MIPEDRFYAATTTIEDYPDLDREFQVPLVDRYLARMIRDQIHIVESLERGSFVIHTSVGIVDMWHCHLPEALPRERAALKSYRERRRALRPFKPAIY